MSDPVTKLLERLKSGHNAHELNLQDEVDALIEMVEVLREAAEIIAQHDVLKTTTRDENGNWKKERVPSRQAKLSKAAISRIEEIAKRADE